MTAVHEYHDGTKHHFHRFARSLGYLDWASQPNPFRSFRDAPIVALSPRPGAAPGTALVGDLLRHALGLSAWKEFRGSRWSLRVNPSSGNLHPTEAYVVVGPRAGVTDTPAVLHYAPDRHALEQRCVFDPASWAEALGDSTQTFFVALTSIHWREAWKYGERAFRYCQHDLGHAIAAVRIAAAMTGWRAEMLPDCSQRNIASFTGIDRDQDYVDAEREEPGCVLAVTPPQAASSRSPVPRPQSPVAGRARLIEAVRDGQWTGRANQLSEDHVEWTFIDEAARATEDAGRDGLQPVLYPGPSNLAPFTRALVVQRRSALALDGTSSIATDRFFAMLSQTMHQEIAADGFFSLGMLADFDRSLQECGPSFYRHLFWESGVVGQVLYLAAEAAGARGTGIGCFYDDPVHDVLGLTGHAFQTLYHFTIGMPVEDTRLTAQPGYDWEAPMPLR